MTSPDLPPLPEYAVMCDCGGNYFEADQLRAVQLAAYRAGMLAAAQIADGDAEFERHAKTGKEWMFEQLAAAIRRAAEGGAAP